MGEKKQKKPTQDFTETKVNMLNVKERVYINNNPFWRCVCDCGKEIFVRHTRLTHGQKSCGCHSTKILVERNTKHGKRSTKIYTQWANMRARCNNPKHKFYSDYGGRGISVCREWDNLKDGFENFYKWSMANGYSDELSIDRIDNNGNYEPLNCRWATSKEQCNNRRNNVFLEYNGETHTMSEWSEIIGIKTDTIFKRLKKGWSVGQVLGFEERKERRLENAKKTN